MQGRLDSLLPLDYIYSVFSVLRLQSMVAD